jgi:hypothetical protein
VNHAPQTVVVRVPVAQGDRGCWRRSKPEDHRAQKAVRKDQPWRPQDRIPRWDRNELRRRAQEWRETARPQAEALKAAGQAMLRAA